MQILSQVPLQATNLSVMPLRYNRASATCRLRPLQQNETIYLWGLSGVLAALAAFIFFFHQPGGPQYWSMPRDDFYYYLKVAQNLAHGRGSTFNGIVPTNGYHPLYLLVIAAICRFTNSLDHILTAVWLLATAMTVVTFHLVYRILRCFSPRVPVCAAAACFLTVACLDLFRDGMEVTLVIPLALGLLLLLMHEGAWTARRCFVASLTAAFMVLARLDSALIIIALALLLPVSRQVRASVTWAKAVAVAAGMVPLAVYLAINVLHFHTLLPISGEAKELRLSHGFSSHAFSSTYDLSIHEHRHLVPGLLAILGLLFLPLALRERSLSRRAALLAMLLLPWQQLVALSFLSDWFIWSWYLYTFNLAACATLCLVLAAAEVRYTRAIVTSCTHCGIAGRGAGSAADADRTSKRGSAECDERPASRRICPDTSRHLCNGRSRGRCRFLPAISPGADRGSGDGPAIP